MLCGLPDAVSFGVGLGGRGVLSPKAFADAWQAAAGQDDGDALTDAAVEHRSCIFTNRLGLSFGGLDAAFQGTLVDPFVGLVISAGIGDLSLWLNPHLNFRPRWERAADTAV